MGYQKRKNGERGDMKDVQERLGNRKGTPNWQGFISCELTAEDKDALRALENSWSDNMSQEMEALGVQGYKLGMSYNESTQTFSVSITDNDPNSAMAGYCLVGRGRSVEHAFDALMYKHTVLLKDGWTDIARPRDEYS